MYTFERDKPNNKIIYHNLLFNNDTVDFLQLFWPQHCGCYLTNYFESTSTVINIKKETVAYTCADLNE